MSYRSRLRKAFQNAPTLPLTPGSRYVIISDCHRGDGSWGDNFLKNQNLYFTSLHHYYTQGFTYIELGDGDELWENRNMEQIIDIHSNVFWLLSRFYQENRLVMLYGNHDMEKKKSHYSTRKCASYFCSDTQCQQDLFPSLCFCESLILKDQDNDHDLYLTHGHQADLFNSTLWILTRFLVRYVWHPLEHFGVLDPTSAAKNYLRKDRTEKRLTTFARQNNIHLITGHTHRPRLNAASPFYINSGSCVHPRCITCLEIAQGELSLVKWSVNVKRDRTLFVERTVLSSCKISDLFLTD